MRLRASPFAPPSPDQPWRSAFSAALLTLLVLPIHAIELDINSEASIKQVAKTLAKGLTSYYTGYRPGDVPGNLPAPYYWWEAGAMFGALIDYWYYTGDDTYNAMTTQALLHQASPSRNFMPVNQTRTEGNDDQSFWGIAAMAAAERKFPDPPPDQPQWLALAQGTFNSQAERWDAETCGGGLRWQIFRFNPGFDYKNTISNGGFFHLGARLATYTNNQTYADWAEKTWDWMERMGLITKEYYFIDGAHNVTMGCTALDRIQWTYNAGINLLGAAYMFNYTKGSEKWRRRVQGIVDGLGIFFESTNIMVEVACERKGNCKVDQLSFKSYLSRWMAATTQVAPFTTDQIMPKLRASAVGAAKACGGGPDGNLCSLKWTTGRFEGESGVGQQMAALEVVQSNLIKGRPPPVTNRTGGTSKGDPSAGYQKGITLPDSVTREITAADKAGAGILTIVIVAVIVATPYWLLSS
ncbi:hypothetical protein AJ78_08883 [Emergomyces pasteurianus Ep9510]|uniref:Mannan endo-1,6-alpha-mannosidase n=1 Tax=Emergomyces pasteurianus Ep9510 TaxID=1447872 RepID=A0A1J9P0K7_9EURO|nr:hypothetical protein AJ78_08883 [Emergomyces pasteurianus Ep9510]